MKKLIIGLALGALALVLLLCGVGSFYFLRFRNIQKTQEQILTTQLQPGEVNSAKLASAGGIDTERYELMLSVRRKVSEVLRQSEAFQMIQNMAGGGMEQQMAELSVFQKLSMAAKFMAAYKNSTAALLAELEKNEMSYDEYWTLTESGFALLLISDEQKNPEQTEIAQEALEQEFRELQAHWAEGREEQGRETQQGEQEGLVLGERTQLAMMRGLFDGSDEGKATLARYREYWLELDSEVYEHSLNFIMEQRDEMVQLGDSVLIDLIMKQFQRRGQGAAAGDSPSTGSLTTIDKLFPAA